MQDSGIDFDTDRRVNIYSIDDSNSYSGSCSITNNGSDAGFIIESAMDIATSKIFLALSMEPEETELDFHIACA